jgi:hypothetical protein
MNVTLKTNHTWWQVAPILEELPQAFILNPTTQFQFSSYSSLGAKPTNNLLLDSVNTPVVRGLTVVKYYSKFYHNVR